MKDQKQAEIDKRKQTAKERQEKLAEKKRLEDAAKKVRKNGRRLCMADLAVIAVLGEEAATDEETFEPVEAGEGVMLRCEQCTERVVVRLWERFTTAIPCASLDSMLLSSQFATS